MVKFPYLDGSGVEQEMELPDEAAHQIVDQVMACFGRLLDDCHYIEDVQIGFNGAIHVTGITEDHRCGYVETETEHFEFPIPDLIRSDDPRAWTAEQMGETRRKQKEEQRKREEEQRKKREAEAEREKTRREKAELARLKAIYEKEG